MPLPIFQAAVNETEQVTQAPIKMICHCAFNAMFSAVQRLANMLRPDGGVAPITNISLIIGGTGERKSSVDGEFFREFYKFRDAQSRTMKRADINYGVRMTAWLIEKKILENRLMASIAGDGSDRERLMEALIEHGLRRPARPPSATFIYQDTSLASLKHGLANFPAACVHSTEGMSILKGALFEEQNLLCNLYSGETYLFDRMGKSVTLADRRLCVSAHSQPERTFRFLAEKGDEFRDSGLAARMTVCLLQSTQGYRHHDAIQVPSHGRDRFNDRVRYLLEVTARSVRKPRFNPRKIKLSPAVARDHLEYANGIERQMRHGGKFQNARDYANRLAEKVARLAAAFHLFEDFEGDISHDTYRAARSVYDEETNDFLYLFNYLPSEEHLADQLFAWLQQHGIPPGEPGFKKSYLEQRGPVQLRKKAALDPALAVLQQQGKVHLRSINKTNYVCPGPALVYIASPPLLSSSV